MKIERKASGTSLDVTQLFKRANAKEICLGCETCKGACAALLEMMQLPDVILGGAGA